MPDFRCYCESAGSTGGAIELSPEESNHLVAANRARAGNLVRVFDGLGNEWEATLRDANKRRAQLDLNTRMFIPPPPYRIALAQALPKGKLIEVILRKATEIGIQELHPLLTQRVESKIDPKREQSKNEKWQAATLEGAKQSGNPRLVEIMPLRRFHEFLGATAGFDLKLIASLAPGAESLKRHLSACRDAPNGASPLSILWLLGPEGDFTPEELEQALAAGFKPATLGPHVMRCDTAALHALSITRYELESAANANPPRTTKSSARRQK